MNQIIKRIAAGSLLLCMAGVCLTGCSSTKEKLAKEEAYRTEGINAMDKGDYAAAMDAFNQALSEVKDIGSNEVDICLYKAAAQFAAGSYSGAIETYDTLLEYDKKNPDVYFLRGCVYLKNQESDKAVADFKQAVKYADDDGMYLQIYDALKGASQDDAAENFLSEATEKKPGHQAKNYTVKGRIYLLKEQYDKAEEQLKKAIEKGDATANLYLAQVYDATDRKEKADDCIRSYIEVYPESSVAYNEQGLSQMEAGQYTDAVAFFRKGLDADEVTDEQELRSNLIAALEYSGDYETAKTELESYLNDYPSDEAAAREYLFLNRDGE